MPDTYVNKEDTETQRYFCNAPRRQTFQIMPPDLIVEGEVIVDVKSVLQFEPVFIAQMLTYLRITGLRRGLILNFNKAVLKAGIKRVTRFD